MSPKALADAGQVEADPGLVPGVSYFQVLEPAPLLGPHGERQYGMVGPFLDLARASQHSMARPGSLITVTLVLFQAPFAAPGAVNGKPLEPGA